MKIKECLVWICHTIAHTMFRPVSVWPSSGNEHYSYKIARTITPLKMIK